MDQKLDLLRRVPLFAGAGQEELEEIARIAEEMEAPEGTELTHEGRHEGYFFVIVSGAVRVEHGGKIVNTLRDGDFLGEIALLDGGPRTATATTESPSELLVMTHPRFADLLDSSPSVRATVLAEVGRRLRRLDAEAAF